MSKCRLCDHLNPAGAERCQKCGTWLIDEATPGHREGAVAEQGVLEVAAPEDSFEVRILDLMRGGKKIEAIKQYRARTGAGLREAKDAVEAMAVQHHINPRGAGCAGASVLLFALAALLAVTWRVLA